MAYRLVGQDCAVTLNDGGVWDGTPTYVGAVDIKALAKSVRVQNNASLHEVTSLGDTREKKRPRVFGARVEVDLLVANTGALTGLAVGNYAKLSIKAVSTLGAYSDYVGVVVENSLDVPDGPEIQRIVIDCDAEVA